jgi:RimJ/RimL family protein N-acetyltransferase
MTSRFPSSVNVSGLGLHLREWTDEDLPAMVALFDDPEIDRWTSLTAPFDLVSARAYLAKGHEGRRSGSRVHLAITDDGHEPKGLILLFRGEEGPNSTNEEIELGYVIGAPYRGRGLATRAVKLLTEYTHETLAINRVLLRIDSANKASEAVARAAGYTLAVEETDGPGDNATSENSLRTWYHDRQTAPGSSGPVSR